jgi:mannose-6-phosphate isomerase-like protein (cupin superfamily)
VHRGDEEVYVILEGRGSMLVNGMREEVGPGDVCITRDGESHSLQNTGETDLRLLVVAARIA